MQKKKFFKQHFHTNPSTKSKQITLTSCAQFGILIIPIQWMKQTETMLIWFLNQVQLYLHRWFNNDGIQDQSGALFDNGMHIFIFQIEYFTHHHSRALHRTDTESICSARRQDIEKAHTGGKHLKSNTKIQNDSRINSTAHSIINLHSNPGSLKSQIHWKDFSLTASRSEYWMMWLCLYTLYQKKSDMRIATIKAGSDRWVDAKDCCVISVALPLPSWTAKQTMESFSLERPWFHEAFIIVIKAKVIMIISGYLSVMSNAAIVVFGERKILDSHQKPNNVMKAIKLNLCCNANHGEAWTWRVFVSSTYTFHMKLWIKLNEMGLLFTMMNIRCFDVRQRWWIINF